MAAHEISLVAMHELLADLSARKYAKAEPKANMFLAILAESSLGDHRGSFSLRHLDLTTNLFVVYERAEVASTLRARYCDVIPVWHAMRISGLDTIEETVMTRHAWMAFALLTIS